MPIKAANIFKALPNTHNAEAFDTLLAKGNVKIERIVSLGHTSPAAGWYDQEQDEWVIVMQGAATLTFKDGQETHLNMGSHLFIPAHVKHRVSWTAPNQQTIWLAVHFDKQQP